jgi:hypothetical protein
MDGLFLVHRSVTTMIGRTDKRRTIHKENKMEIITKIAEGICACTGIVSLAVMIIGKVKCVTCTHCGKTVVKEE